MGRSSSKPLQKPNSPLQEMQYKESKRERNRLQQEKVKKQILRLQQKQAKKQTKKTKRKYSSSSGDKIKAAQNHLRKEAEHNNSLTCQPVSAGDRPSSTQMLKRCDFHCGDLNRQLEAKIQKQLNEDLADFLLNQMALTIQFVKHYESEISVVADDMLSSEKLFNHNLEEHSILLTNPLDMAVTKSICYKPLHGPDKHNKQLLQTQTMYVVFENIDIARPNDANYDSISPLCKVDIELDFHETTPYKENYMELLNNIKWKGYVRLRLREDNKESQPLVTDFEDVYSEGSSGYGTTTPYSSRLALNTLENISTTNTNAEQDYDYAFITYLNTQHPLKELKMTYLKEKSKIDDKVLPETCISALGSFVQILQEAEFTDDEEEEGEDDEEYAYRDYDTLQAIKLYKIELETRRKLLQQNYLNSHEFMKYFGELVRKKLAPKLNITDRELSQASYRGTSIYTNNYELIPAIYAAQNVSDWPKCAFEFRLRDRAISTHPQTGQQIQWPSRAMIKRIETFGFHVVPLGYAPKKKRNPFRDIEWRIVFPKAERYLEQHLSNAQVKVYMITKALLKCFAEPVEANKALMFALDNLRMHLFWECERDYTAWPEEFLGEVLLRFINSFKQRVKEKQLSDYFIRERNLFESIPEYSLNSLYTILSDITANPVMYVMIALRNLQFKSDYFPKLNFKKLYENLIANDIVKLKLLAKNARSLIDLKQENDDETCLMADEGAQGLVGLKQHHVRTNGKLRRKTYLLKHNMEIKKQQMQAKRPSVESIDVEFFFKRNIKASNMQQFNQGVENLRRTNTLEIVLDHLLEMSARAVQFQNAVLAKIYLSQARRLCKFYHNYGCDVGAKGYLAAIHNLDEELQIIYDQEDFSMAPPPSLPRRISMEPMLPAIPHNLAINSCNLYEEMVPQEIKNSLKFNTESESEQEKVLKQNKLKSPVSRKSIKFHSLVVEVEPGDISPLQCTTQTETEIKTCLKTPSSKITNSDVNEPKPREPLKVNKPSDYSLYTEMSTENLQTCTEALKENQQVADKKSLIPVYLRQKLKTSKDFINSSPLGSSEFLQNISQSTNQLMTHLTAEEKKAEIREMLKRKTLKLKGVFNQSSDT